MKKLEINFIELVNEYAEELKTEEISTRDNATYQAAIELHNLNGSIIHYRSLVDMVASFFRAEDMEVPYKYVEKTVNHFIEENAHINFVEDVLDTVVLVTEFSDGSAVVQGAGVMNKAEFEAYQNDCIGSIKLQYVDRVLTMADVFNRMIFKG